MIDPLIQAVLWFILFYVTLAVAQKQELTLFSGFMEQVGLAGMFVSGVSVVVILLVKAFQITW